MSDSSPSEISPAQIAWASACGAVGLLFLFGPAHVLAQNAAELSLPSPNAIAAHLGIMVASAAGAWITAKRAAMSRHRPLKAVILAIVLLLYLQFHFFAWNLGVFDGREIRFEEFRVQAVIEVISFGVVLGLAVARPREFVGTAFRILCVVLLINCLAFTVDLFKILSNEPDDSVADRSDFFSAPDEVVARGSLFSDRNVIIILLDTAQGDVVADIIRRNPDVRAGLSGFTIYPDTAAAFPYTALSIPLILTGQRYRPESESIKEYLLRVGSQRVGTSLALKGYVNTEIPLGERAKFLSAAEAACRNDMAILDTYLFRQAPLVAKRWWYNGGEFRMKAMCGTTLIPATNSEIDLQVLKVLADSAAPTTSEPVAKFVHLWAFHPPGHLDENCHRLAAPRYDLQGVIDQGTCVMRHLVGLLDEMRRLGTFEESTIAIVADHGTLLGFLKTQEPLGGVPESVRSSANAVLAIKYPRATGPVSFDPAPAMLDDLVPTLLAASGVEVSVKRALGSVLGEAPELRPRPFVFYREAAEAQKDHLGATAAFVIEGPVASGSSWREDGSASDVNTSESNILRTIDFSRPEHRQRNLGIGWSAEAAGYNFSWITEKQARLRGNLPIGDCVSLHLELLNLHPGQVLSVSKGSQTIAELNLNPAERWSVHSIELRNATKAVGGISMGVRVLEALPGSAVSRKLGVAVRKLQFSSGCGTHAEG